MRRQAQKSAGLDDERLARGGRQGVVVAVEVGEHFAGRGAFEEKSLEFSVLKNVSTPQKESQLCRATARGKLTAGECERRAGEDVEEVVRVIEEAPEHGERDDRDGRRDPR